MSDDFAKAVEAIERAMKNVSKIRAEGASRYCVDRIWHNLYRCAADLEQTGHSVTKRLPGS